MKASSYSWTNLSLWLDVGGDGGGGGGGGGKLIVN